MSFENAKKYLDSNYMFVKGTEKDYYCDKDNKIVATINNQVITLYINDPEDELETQYQVVALPVINSEILEQIEAIELKGENNDIIIEGGIPVACYNDELDRISSRIDMNNYSQKNLGNTGIISNKTAIIPLENKTITVPLKEEKKSSTKIKTLDMNNQSKGCRKKLC